MFPLLFLLAFSALGCSGAPPVCVFWLVGGGGACPEAAPCSLRSPACAPAPRKLLFALLAFFAPLATLAPQWLRGQVSGANVVLSSGVQPWRLRSVVPCRCAPTSQQTCGRVWRWCSGRSAPYAPTPNAHCRQGAHPPFRSSRS